MEPSTADLDDMLKKVSRVDYLRVTVADLSGVARGKLIPQRCIQKFLEEGMPIYAGTIALTPSSDLPMETALADLHAHGHPSGVVHADPSTFQVLPWAGVKQGVQIGEVYGETYDSAGKEQGACPRQVTIKQIERLKARGWRIKSGTELEARFFDSAGKSLTNSAGFLSQLDLAAYEDLFIDIVQNMKQVGVHIDAVHAEYGCGQYELVVACSDGIKGADDVFRLRHGVKELCRQRAHSVSYLARPATDGCGSGAHFNFSIWDEKTGKNLFADDTADDGLSAMAHHWISGLIAHAPALTALCCPTVNCYRRLHSCFVPSAMYWGVDNRLATYRVKTDGEAGTYIENRLPSGVANPYLVMAATIAAGLEGVDSHLPPTPANQTGAPALPHYLSEALSALEADQPIRSALGEELVQWYAGMRREIDLKKFADHDVKKSSEEEILVERQFYELQL